MQKDDSTHKANAGSQKPEGRIKSLSDLNEFESYDRDPSVLSTNPVAERSDAQPVCQFRHGDMIGKYLVVGELGTGGFGHVLLCRDPQLLRMVAIKFPRSDRPNFSIDKFLEEGRSVARLDHPSIVKVYNIEETDYGLPFAVMEYIEGPTLHQFINEQGLTFSVALKLLIQLAEALDYAHSRTLIHRDLKPSNVIITRGGDRAKLMDFGMALHDMTPEESLLDIPEGTPPYMAPEQIRGENHRLDRRTDIWGFGAMMYVMLTGQRPFAGKDLEVLVSQICKSDPIPPRRINPDVPRELERICLKCLEKLMSSRYQSAAELVEDFKMFEANWDSGTLQTGENDLTGVLPLASRPMDQRPDSGAFRGTSRISTTINTEKVKVVPKGLRSFDAQDADFFLDLLPGPKDRFGIPDSLRFWMNKLAPNSIEPLTVGLIFGPSGCGKSSLVKAGLLPRLPKEFKTIYLEATPHDTEQTLVNKIGQLSPDVLSGDPGLSVALSRIRRGHLIQGQKLLIVIDQFEQWLQAHNDLADQPLIEALRHCDGEHLSCILLVRDDFWMSATRFMSQLDLKVQDGVNSLGIPLFDKRHARKVLAAYGQASEALPDTLSAEQQKFIAATVDEISDHDEIIPIHLALFTQMMDSDSWHSTRLKQLGGWQGIGVQFLEKISSDKRISRHEGTLRAVLASLLPPPTSEIKGTKKSLSDLAAAAGLENNLDELHTIMDYLDRDVRIVGSIESEEDDGKQPHYQLTHDFLVSPVRKWITLKENETWQGRANIRLNELSRQWETQHDSRFLPGPLEYVFMLLGVDRKSINDSGRAFLGTATRYHGIRAAGLLFVLFALGFAGQSWLNLTNSRIAQVKVDSLLAATPEEVDARLENLENYDVGIVLSQIGAALENPGTDRDRLHALLAKSRVGGIDDIPVGELVGAIEWAEKGECRNILNALRRVAGTPRQDELFTSLNSRFQVADSADHKTRLSIVALYLGDPNPAVELLKLDPDPELRERFIDLFPVWHGDPKETCEIIRRTDNPLLVSTLLKSMGQLTAEGFSDDVRNLLAKVASEKIYSATEPVVFSTCQWLLRLSGETIPDELNRTTNNSVLVKRFDEQPPIVFLRVDPQLVPGRKYGLTADDLLHFIREGWSGTEDEFLDKGFYMSSTEVSASLFFEFLMKHEANGYEQDLITNTRKVFEKEMTTLQEKLDAGLPIYNLKWEEAVVFCNWLSKRDGLEPVYYTDKLTDESTYWRPFPHANGYRLPTMLQWDAANRTGTRSRFFFGDSSQRLFRYAVTAIDPIEYPGIPVSASGRKMPNSYGFFDLLGNVDEWCEGGLNPPETRGYTKPLRGGNAKTVDLNWYASGAMFEQPVYQRVEPAGFRLVLPIND